MSFFKRLAELFSRSEAAPSPAVAQSSSAPTRPPLAPRAVAISWREILDANTRITGYLLRQVALRADLPVSGEALLAALRDERLARLSERRLVLIPLSPAQWQGADFRVLANANTYFLLTADTPEAKAVWQAAAADLRAVGGRLAVGHAQLLGDTSLAGLADLLLIRLGDLSLSALERQVAQWRAQHPALQLVVEDVATWDEYRFLLSLGVTHCIGPFATLPDEAQQREQVSQGRLVVVEMMNQLRGEADLASLATVAGRDPAVVVKLLEMANSPVYGLARPVATIEEAIMLLGRETLYRWLALAMFRIDGDSGHDETLMVIALSRASYLESLAPEADRRIAGELFLVGLLSLIDSLLKMPMPKIVERMNLPAEVAEVLLRGGGPYASHLALVMAMERCQLERASVLAGMLGLAPDEVVTNYGEAMAWATAACA